jgi:putative SOS response-associated peptidase YedK
MCGRYVLKTSTLELKREFHLDQVPALHARYNIAPTQAAPIIRAPKTMVVAQWGLLPSWAKEARQAHTLINARVETLKTKASFRTLLGTHRCLVPCDGFYEWRRDGRQRVPHFIHDPKDRLMAMAGLWNRWRSAEGIEVDTFTIVTTAARGPLTALHDRSPVFLADEGRDAWLDPHLDFAQVEGLLRPRVLEVAIDEVAPFVNSVAIDDERCLSAPTTTQLRLL